MIQIGGLEAEAKKKKNDPNRTFKNKNVVTENL